MLSAEEMQIEGLPSYKHLEGNEFSSRKHKKQKEEDIAVCVCRYNANDLDSACGDQCLNVLTSTECTPGYCPCGNYCKNQRFQKCEYAKAKLFKTEGRGWGLRADENIKAGQFVIEYCGEVISWKEAKRRSQSYEAEGLKDAYIISLNAYESIDATRKGSLARFINHSCQPNCETRKWTVLGEIRVGIFAKQDIPAGTELSYDYNFEWYGGAKVCCLCGATGCSEFLGAKSRGFQASLHMRMEQKEAAHGRPFTAYERRLAEDEVFEEVYGRDGHGRIRCCDHTISPTDYFRIPTAPPVDAPIAPPVIPTPSPVILTPSPVTPTPAPIEEIVDHTFRPLSSNTPSAEAITQRDLARWRITKQCLEIGIPVSQEIISDDWWPESSSL